MTREIDVVEEVARVRARPRAAHAAAPASMSRAPDARAARCAASSRTCSSAPGFSEAYTRSLAREPTRDPDALRLPEPMTLEQAVLRTTLLPASSRRAHGTSTSGATDRAVRDRARLPARRASELPEERWRVGGDRRGRVRRAKGVVETLYGALHLELRVRARPTHPLLHPGKAGRDRRGRRRRAAPGAARGHAGARSSSTSTRSFDAVAGAVALRGRDHLPGRRQDIAVVVAEDVEAGALVAAAREAAGPELREVARLRRLPRRAGRRGAASRSRSTSRSSRPSGRSPTRRRRAPGAIVAALAERFGAELRA